MTDAELLPEHPKPPLRIIENEHGIRIMASGNEVGFFLYPNEQQYLAAWITQRFPRVELVDPLEPPPKKPLKARLFPMKGTSL